MNNGVKASAELALEEYNSTTETVRRGGNGRPFWNTYSTRFTFCPSFGFTSFLRAKKYLFTATDSTGAVYTFTDSEPTAMLSPIWGKLATGIVTLTVEAYNRYDENIKYLIGARTFFKCSPFMGRESYGQKALPYVECAAKAFKYVFDQPMIQYWAIHGKPDPEYYHNVYPSKMISSIVRAMVYYAKVEPKDAEQAMKVAISATDYLLSLTYEDGTPMEGLPPTYSFKGLNAETVNATAPAAQLFRDTNMMIYPAFAGKAYLTMYKETGNKKYFDAAKRITDYYKSHVLPCGSWYLKVSCITGEPVSNNVCVDFNILSFLHDMAEATADSELRTLEKNYFDHLIKTCLENYNWEGQFEDVEVTPPYENLTHFGAGHLIKYIKENLSDSPEWVEVAAELIRYIEDQFVIWGEHEPWRINGHYKKQFGDNSHLFSPCGEEQYHCYDPIDSSGATIMESFLNAYVVTGNKLLLEKALTLGDMITRMQNAETGVIPTFWVKKDCMDVLDNFWINCHIHSAFQLMNVDAFMKANNLGE